MCASHPPNRTRMSTKSKMALPRIRAAQRREAWVTGANNGVHEAIEGGGEGRGVGWSGEAPREKARMEAEDAPTEN